MNGWQRLWVIAAVLWMLFAVFSDGGLLERVRVTGGWPTDFDSWSWLITAWSISLVIPPIVLYFAGLTAAWVKKGFK